MIIESYGLKIHVTNILIVSTDIFNISKWILIRNENLSFVRALIIFTFGQKYGIFLRQYLEHIDYFWVFKKEIKGYIASS